MNDLQGTVGGGSPDATAEVPAVAAAAPSWFPAETAGAAAPAPVAVEAPLPPEERTYEGVSREKDGTWVADIKFDKEEIKRLGTFATAGAAGWAYDAAREERGLQPVNFPLPGQASPVAEAPAPAADEEAPPPVADEGPNAMVFAPSETMLVACYDDGHARVLQSTARYESIGRNGKPVRGQAPLLSLGTSADFALVVEHAVAPPPVAGKRARTIPATHCAALSDTSGTYEVCAFACSAGKLVHCVDVPSGELRHAHTFEAPVRALCRNPEVGGYYVAYGTTIARVAVTNDGPAEGDGIITRSYTSTRPLRSSCPRC